ncbi:MAG: penicillin acylase family protein [Planctomycetaceae bacterium]
MAVAADPLLARLGAGEPIASVCATTGLTREEFDAWWRNECAVRVPPATGIRHAPLAGPLRIERDRCGIPHIHATVDDDLFFGFGYATAQDRLFQLDYLRRRALGRLAEVLGKEGLEPDLVARTVGLHRIAQAEWESLPDETRRLVAAYSRGINAFLDDCRGRLPLEFDLLSYTPEPWRPQDCLAIAGEFRWYLTGRIGVIAIPELAKRVLGDGPLYQAVLRAEADSEAILPAGAYPLSRCGLSPVPSGEGWATTNSSEPRAGEEIGSHSKAQTHHSKTPPALDGQTGSNNWVISASKSASGKPLLASDPHIAFAAVSCWHEAHLCGGSFNVAGTAYAGVPAIVIGRNERVAWGITNNICSQRDLYQEQTDPQHPGCFLFDGRWEPALEREEVIHVRGEIPLNTTIRCSRNGPIIDHLLPPEARGAGPVSLKWLGASRCGWLEALSGMNRARTADELRQATEPWLVPTFCVVYADVEGHVGYQCTGRIPVREIRERGVRPGWDPKHQWTGLIPFEGMPRWADPPRGWIATANNRVAADDFPYPLAGTSLCNYRAVRIRQLLAGQARFTLHDFRRMQHDTLSLRAVECVPRMCAALQHTPGVCGEGAAEQARLRTAFEILTAWDRHVEPDSVAAAIFNVFFALWCQRVADERFSRPAATLVAATIGALASDLLAEDEVGWFAESVSAPESDRDADALSHAPSARESAITETLLAALGHLTERLGPDHKAWAWGRLHALQQPHVLSGRGDLGKLLDRGSMAVGGDYVTVGNTGQAPDFTAPSGAGYQFIADLADPQAGLWAVDAGSESGNPGSPHYDDQIEPWLRGEYHYLALKPGAIDSEPRSVLSFVPSEPGRASG